MTAAARLSFAAPVVEGGRTDRRRLGAVGESARTPARRGRGISVSKEGDGAAEAVKWRGGVAVPEERTARLMTRPSRRVLGWAISTRKQAAGFAGGVWWGSAKKRPHTFLYTHNDPATEKLFLLRSRSRIISPPSHYLI